MEAASITDCLDTDDSIQMKPMRVPTKPTLSIRSIMNQPNSCSPPPPPATLLGDAIVGGKIILEMRARYESVDQANLAREGQASTLRTRLGWETGDYHGFMRALLDRLENVHTDEPRSASMATMTSQRKRNPKCRSGV